MASILQKKLMTLTSGQRIRLSYGEKACPNTLSAQVVDTDHESSFELLSDDGQSLFIAFEDVRTLALEGPAITAPTPQSAPVVLVEKPAFWQLARRPKPSDADIKALLANLPSRRELEPCVQSFFAGVRNSDAEKMVQAALRAKRVVISKPVTPLECELAAALLNRTKQDSSEAYAACGNWENGAAWAFWAENYPMAQALAATALAEGGAENPGEMLGVLGHSCKRSKDVSCLEYVLVSLPDAAHSDAAMLLDYLSVRAGCAVLPGTPWQEKLAALTAVWPGTEAKAALNELAYRQSESEVCDALQPDEINADSAELAGCLYGILTSVSLVREKGTLRDLMGEEHEFLYDDIADPDCKTLIRGLVSTDLSQTAYGVEFLLSGGRAVKLTLAEKPQRIANQMTQTLGQNKVYALKHASPYYALALHTPDAANALEAFLHKAVEAYRQGFDPAVCSLADGLLDEWEERLTPAMTWPQRDSVIEYQRAVGRPDQACARLENALKTMELREVEYEQCLSIYLNLLLARYQKTSDQAAIKKAAELCSAFEAKFGKIGEQEITPQNASHLSAIYAAQIQADCALKRPEKAKKHLELYQKNFPNASKMAALQSAVAALQQPGLPAPAPVPAAPSTQGEESRAEEYTASPYQDRGGWQALGRQPQEVISMAMRLHEPEQLGAFLSILKVMADLTPEGKSLYTLASLAAENPMERNDYTAGRLLTLSSEIPDSCAEFAPLAFAASALRTAFLSRESFCYLFKVLPSLFAAEDAVSASYELLVQYRSDHPNAVPSDFSAYERLSSDALAERLAELHTKAGVYYTQYVLNPPRENASIERLLLTKKLVWAQEGELAEFLNALREGNCAWLLQNKTAFLQKWSERGEVCLQAVEDFIDSCWNTAKNQMNTKHNTTKLMGSKRTSLAKAIEKVLQLILDWYAAKERAQDSGESQAAETAYLALQPALQEKLQALAQHCEVQRTSPANADPARAGYLLLERTAQDLLARINGSYSPQFARGIFLDFLRSDDILLDEDYLPDLRATFCNLPQGNILTRLQRFTERRSLPTLEEHLAAIYAAAPENHNFGTAKLIEKVLHAQGKTAPLPAYADWCVAQGAEQSKQTFLNFRRLYAEFALHHQELLANDPFAAGMENALTYWYLDCRETRNEGFFYMLSQQCRRYLEQQEASEALLPHEQEDA